MRRHARRTFLAAAVGAVAGLAGCTGGGSGAGETTADRPTRTTATTEATETTVTPRLTSRTFDRTGQCSDPRTASVAFDGDTVTVAGCVTGNNGCHEAVLRRVVYDAERDVLRVAVDTEDTSDPGTMCTQALVHRAYEARLRFAEGLPGTVEVFHKGATGSGRVARVERDG
jgi:hypothetical protein